MGQDPSLLTSNEVRTREEKWKGKYVHIISCDASEDNQQPSSPGWLDRLPAEIAPSVKIHNHLCTGPIGRKVAISYA